MVIEICLGVVLLALLALALYFNWQGTKPMSDEAWDRAYNKAWNDSLKKLSGKNVD